MNLKTELPINQLNMHHESYFLYMGMVEAFSSFTKATRRGRSYVNTSDIFCAIQVEIQGSGQVNKRKQWHKSCRRVPA